MPRIWPRSSTQTRDAGTSGRTGCIQGQSRRTHDVDHLSWCGMTRAPVKSRTQSGLLPPRCYNYMGRDTTAWSGMMLVARDKLVSRVKLRSQEAVHQCTNWLQQDACLPASTRHHQEITRVENLSTCTRRTVYQSYVLSIMLSIALTFKTCLYSC